MDPLTTIGLASAIVQFVDYSTKIIHGAREIYESTSGVTEENRSLESIVSKMKELTSKLLPSTGSPRSEEEEALCRVAAECNILSDQIIELLGKLKPKDSKSKRQSTLAAFKNKLREREKLELEKRLANCRSQLELQLTFLTSSETKTRLETLVSAAKGDGAKLEQLQKDIFELQKGVVLTSISPEAQNQLQKLLNLSEDACKTIFQQRILSSLAFEGMHGRFEAVNDAHYKTFEWIFESEGNDSNGDESGDAEKAEGDQSRRSASQLFKQWLASGKGIFHISGKLGSGKSTLTKFLFEHDRTKEELQKWAGDRKLVFANFFFWKPGIKLQRSLGGLFRSLLHDVLKSCPELIRTVLPDQWNAVKSMPWQIQTQLEFGTKDIRAAFLRLTENRNLYEKRCFCYFIDGLDEYEETPQEDYTSMVEILSDWATASSDNVKICISSREYNVFLNGFSSERRIRLQDLTRGDMECYVRGKLQRTGHDDLKELVQTILDKGNGIFLWVTLVVKSLRERLEDGHELSTLEAELDTLPDELEDLFTHLLMSLDKSARKKTYQFFAMLLKSRPFGIGLSPLACSFLDDFDDNPEFALESNFPHHNMKISVKDQRIYQTRKRINGYGKGLLELKECVSEDKDSCLAFTHHSIPEFLETPMIEKDMSLSLKEFNPVEAISQLLLAEIRLSSPHTMPRRELGVAIYRIVSLRYRSKIDQAPFVFLESLSSAARLHKVPESRRDDRLPDTICTTCLGTFTLVNPFLSSWKLSSTKLEGHVIISPLYTSAIVGHVEYVKWKAENDERILDSNYRTTILLCCIYFPLFTKWSTTTEGSECIDFLLIKGLSPRALVHTTSAPKSSFLQDDFRQEEVNFWVHFFRLLLNRYSRNSRLEQKSRIGEMIETFLQYGADPRLHISTFECRKSFAAKVEYIDQVFEPEEVRFVWASNGMYFGICEQEYKFIAEKGGRISLRELVEFWQFENEKVILQLLDRNLEELERESQAESQSAVVDGTILSKESRTSQSEVINESVSEPDLMKAGESLSAPPPISMDSDGWSGDLSWGYVVAFVLGVFVAIVIARLL